MIEFAGAAVLMKLGVAGLIAFDVLLLILVMQHRKSFAKFADNLRDNHLKHIYDRLDTLNSSVARIEGRLNGPK